MIVHHVHIFGIPLDKLAFKKECLRMIQSQTDDPKENDVEYYDFDDFFDSRVPDLDWQWIDYDAQYRVPYVIGILPAYSWQVRVEDPSFDTEDKAREFIADKLLPFVSQSREELINLSDYLDIPEGC